MLPYDKGHPMVQAYVNWKAFIIHAYKYPQTRKLYCALALNEHMEYLCYAAEQEAKENNGSKKD